MWTLTYWGGLSEYIEPPWLLAWSYSPEAILLEMRKTSEILLLTPGIYVECKYSSYCGQHRKTVCVSKP